MDGARAMVEEGDWLVPRYRGEPFFDKPPLAYWLIGLSFEGLGFSLMAARLVPALAAAGNAGSVWLQDCVLKGFSQPALLGFEAGSSAVSAVDCDSLVITRGTLSGGSAMGGSPAIESSGSNVRLYDVVVKGGAGQCETVGTVHCADGAAAVELRKLTDHRADRARGGRDGNGFACLRLGYLQQADPGGHARHAGGAEIDRERQLRGPQLLQRLRLGHAMGLPAEAAEHLVPRLDPRLLAHEGHRVRLRDRLLQTDRQGSVFVGQIGQLRRHKLLARHPIYRLQHPRIVNIPPFKLLDDHVVPLRTEVHVTILRDGC